MAVFEAQKHRMKSFYQEGLLKAEDAPSEMNLEQAKKTIRLELKAEMRETFDIFSKTIMDCLTGIENIFSDPINLNESELRTMDLILGSRLILKFFTGLSSSEDGLMKVIEDLRIWEKAAPTVRKDRLNTLIQALKGLKEPVMAGTIASMLREGLPSRLDNLVDHLIDTTSKTLGDIGVITVSPWTRVSSKSSLERVISSTTVLNPVPVHTSSRSGLNDSETPETSTRETLDKLKAKIRDARTAFDRK